MHAAPGPDDDLAGLAHAHGHVHGGRHARPAAGTPEAAARRRLHVVLAALLVPLVIAAAVGALLLRPTGDREQLPSGLGPASGLVSAELESRQEVPCPERDVAPEDELVPVVPELEAAAGAETTCISAQVRILEGPTEGDRFVLDALSTPSQPFPEDGRIVLSYDPGAEAGQEYAYADVERSRPLALLGVLFALAVLVLGRFTGLRALLGLGLSLVVLTAFVLPALLDGRDALLVALSSPVSSDPSPVSRVATTNACASSTVSVSAPSVPRTAMLVCTLMPWVRYSTANITSAEPQSATSSASLPSSSAGSTNAVSTTSDRPRPSSARRPVKRPSTSTASANSTPSRASGRLRSTSA